MISFLFSKEFLSVMSVEHLNKPVKKTKTNQSTNNRTHKAQRSHLPKAVQVFLKVGETNPRFTSSPMESCAPSAPPRHLIHHSVYPFHTRLLSNFHVPSPVPGIGDAILIRNPQRKRNLTRPRTTWLGRSPAWKPGAQDRGSGRKEQQGCLMENGEAAKGAGL